MKVFVALFALMAVAAAAPGSERMLHAILQAKWNNFKATHGKEYHAHEEPKRMQNFLKKTHMIETHNERFAKGLESFHMGHNELSDLTHEEFVSTRLGAVPPAQEDANITEFRPTAGFRAPQSIDWRTWNHVQRVKNQGSCGSCYTFAAVASLESMIMRKYNLMYDLSEQQLVDCSSSYGNGGCGGGWMHNCFKYIQDNGGINQQHLYPYEGQYRNCRYNNRDAQGRLSNYVRIPYGNEKALQEAVATIGPVAIAYDASTREFANYQGGIYSSPSCNGDRMTHAVTVTGYGSENGREYWTLKNSWGENWGEKGYFRMARNQNNMCGIANGASYPIVA